MSATPAFTPAATQPCSPFTSYNGPWGGFRTGIGGVAGGQAMCETNASENNFSDYLYVHYQGDDGSPLGYWDCWAGGVQVQSVLCGRLGRRQAYTSTPNAARVPDFQIYEQMASAGLLEPTPSVLSPAFPSSSQDALPPFQPAFSSFTQPYAVAPNDLPAVITVSTAAPLDTSPSSIPDVYSNALNAPFVFPDVISATPATLGISPDIQPDYEPNNAAISSVPAVVIVPEDTVTYAPIPTDNAPANNIPLLEAQPSPFSPNPQPDPLSPNLQPIAPQPDAQPNPDVVVLVTTWVVDTATAAVTVTLAGAAFAATSVALAAASAVVTAAEPTVTHMRFYTVTETRWFQAPECVRVRG
ncbi:uncharacterized protein K452DRAFT_65522 [Aplosporella prunicola CBS 121167]|uniref:Uncharacterized protein n=1 Tax=Aplosporella prunicola CBS 121167 TaxID=1176127 RepID=A0A6A6BQL9_9PEZI|nr:uncharacterized protein K452DRAFT_65522 [Aplosporella prunicola CBS 121167]KAF2146422.1 hypothetical protein K452DRAFT_65522 [Aplosporella prunicola CBS 121167]